MVTKNTTSYRETSVWTTFYNTSCPSVNVYRPYGRESYRNQNGLDMPNWRSVIRNQGNASNPYACVSLSTTYESDFASNVYKPSIIGSCSAPLDFYAGVISGTDVVSYRIDFSSFSSATTQSLALASFVRKARKRMTKIDTGVTLGELGETLRFLRSPLRSIVHHSSEYVNSARKVLNHPRRKLTKRDFAAMAGEQYLNYQYAIKPLVADITSGVNAYNKLLELPTSHYEMIRGSSKSEVFQRTNNIGNTFGLASFSGTSTEKVDVKVMYYGMLQISTHMGAGYARDVLGLTADNFFPTLWELVPYSFLVDQVANFDDIISAASFDFRRFAWINRSTMFESRTENSWSIVQGYPGAPNYQFKSAFGAVGLSKPRSFSLKRELLNPLTFNEVPGLIINGDRIAKTATTLLSLFEARNLYQRDLQHKFPDVDLRQVPLSAGQGLKRGFR